MNDQRKIIVCMPYVNDAYNNPFLYLLNRHLETHVTLVTNSWKNMLFTKYDVLHIHWPEYLFYGKNRKPNIFKLIALVALILRNKVTRTPIVTTYHDRLSSEKYGAIALKILHIWYHFTSAKIFMNHIDEPLGINEKLIFHGHYFDIVNTYPKVSEEPGSGFLHFGVIDAYKSLHKLIQCFSETEFNLEIVGKAADSNYFDSLQHEKGESKNIKIYGTSLLEEDLILRIMRTEYCIFPYLDIYNSGSVFLALSCQKQTIVTTSATMEELQREVGTHWLQLLPVNFSKKDLDSAVKKLKSNKPANGEEIKFGSKRNWNFIASQHFDFYLTLLSKKSSK